MGFWKGAQQLRGTTRATNICLLWRLVSFRGLSGGGLSGTRWFLLTCLEKQLQMGTTPKPEHVNDVPQILCPRRLEIRTRVRLGLGRSCLPLWSHGWDLFQTLTPPGFLCWTLTKLGKGTRTHGHWGGGGVASALFFEQPLVDGFLFWGLSRELHI